MTTPKNINTNDPIIPPTILIGITILAYVIGLISYLYGAEDVQSLGALGVGTISLIAAGVMNPQEVMAILRGRSMSFGGTAIIITALLLVAFGVIYALVASQKWQKDLTGTDEFSLNPGVREVIETLAADPTVPDVRIIGFYTIEQATSRDQIELLLSDFEEASGGKISYEFIDPNRAPLALESYGATASQLVVARLDAETGEAIPEDAQLVNSFSRERQLLITDSVITLTARGDFRAYFLNVESGISISDSSDVGADFLANQLRERYGWTVEEVSPLSLLSLLEEESSEEDGSVQIERATGILGEDITYLDPAADGEVVVIPGGQETLPQNVTAALIRYMEAGGDVVIFADQSPTPDQMPLALEETLSDYLYESFGMRVNNDLVIDPRALTQLGTLAVQTTDFGTHPITDQLTVDEGLVVQLQMPHSLDIAAESNATVLMRSDSVAYTKPALDLTAEITMEMLQQTRDDVSGALPIAAAAENPETGSRLVLIGGADPLLNVNIQLLNLGIFNYIIAQESLFWTTDYENMAGTLANIPTLVNEQNAPINFANPGVVNTINLVVLFILPFGILGSGIFVWWVRRERAA